MASAVPFLFVALCLPCRSKDWREVGCRNSELFTSGLREGLKSPQQPATGADTPVLIPDYSCLSTAVGRLVGIQKRRRQHTVEQSKVEQLHTLGERASVNQ